MERKTRSTKYVEPPEEQEELEESSNSSRPHLKRLLIILFFLILVTIFYAVSIEPYLFTVKEYKIESNLLPESFNGLKIIHFSDIHYGTTINSKELKKIVTKINELKPDIIIFTGDLIDKSIEVNDDIINEITTELQNLDASLYKYAVFGDEDNETTQSILENCNFKILNNETYLLYYNGSTPIELIGFNTPESNPNYTIVSDMIEDISPTSLYRIVLVHEPDTISNYIIYNPNLVLSGHTLGGLINIVKPLFLNGSTHYLDYENLNGTELYISNGLGTTDINARLKNRPSFNLYRLYTSTN